MCPYETVAYGFSRFCNLFTYEEWQGFGYSIDLEFSGISAFHSPTGVSQPTGTWTPSFSPRRSSADSLCHSLALSGLLGSVINKKFLPASGTTRSAIPGPRSTPRSTETPRRFPSTRASTLTSRTTPTSYRSSPPSVSPSSPPSYLHRAPLATATSPLPTSRRLAPGSTSKSFDRRSPSPPGATASSLAPRRSTSTSSSTSAPSRSASASKSVTPAARTAGASSTPFSASSRICLPAPFSTTPALESTTRRRMRLSPMAFLRRFSSVSSLSSFSSFFSCFCFVFFLGAGGLRVSALLPLSLRARRPWAHGFRCLFSHLFLFSCIFLCRPIYFERNIILVKVELSSSPLPFFPIQDMHHAVSIDNFRWRYFAKG